MALHRLVFDTTSTDTQNESANVGAYLRASDGTLLTHTGGALNVSFSTVTDLDIRDLNASQDNVAISDGTDTLAINADGSINITDNGGSITIDATDLDIRDLDSATDSVAAVQSGSWEVSLDAATLAALETITVTATDLDIRDLDAAQDSVQANLFDGAGNSISSTSNALNVHIASGDLDDSLANTAIVVNATSVNNTVGGTDLIGTDLANRKWLFAYNNGNRDAFIGPSGVTAATGFPLPSGAMIELRAGPAINLHAITNSGTADMRMLQLS
jgi:hypothetical protein